MRILRIAPGLYQCSFTNKHPMAVKRQALVDLGIDTVVCLCPRRDTDWIALGVEYLHRHFPDGKLDQEVAGALVSLAAELAKKPTLVYCFGGRNRSVFLSALIYRAQTGCSGREAMQHLLSYRPKALTNGEFRGFLESLPALLTNDSR